MPHRDPEIDRLVATMVKAGVWSKAEGERHRRAFQSECERDDRYIRTGRPRRLPRRESK